MPLSSSTKAKTNDGTTTVESTRPHQQEYEYELYPFLVDATTTVKLSSSSSSAIVGIVGNNKKHHRSVAIIPYNSGTITTTGKTTTNNDNSKNSEYFETTSSQDNTECIWYQTARNEWKQQQQIIGDYIPSYTTVQKDMMIQNLTLFANKIETEIQQQQQHKQLLGSNSTNKVNVNGIENANANLVLISLLRRYAYQIEKYV